MNRICRLTRRKTLAGGSISHSHVVSKRQFKVNLQKKNVTLSNGQKTKVRLSAKAIRSIDNIKAFNTYANDKKK